MRYSPTLLTFGYEGLAIEDFLRRLQHVGITLVVDVRELPLSRKKGFSKSAFRDRLALAGIDYQHIPALGCPKSIRDKYRQDNDWREYTKAFQTYLKTKRAEVQALADTARESLACLVCYEADHEMCHRTYVAQAAHAAGGPKVGHITSETVVPDAKASPTFSAGRAR